MSNPDCDLYQRFRDASVYAVDMGLTLALAMGLGFETRLGAEYTRYVSSFKPQPGDQYVAGGALDLYVALRAGAAYVF
jgi:hypothetical protein